MSLLIVDDHTAIAEAIAGSLRLEGFGPVVVVRGERRDEVLAEADRVRPTVVLVDLHLGEHSDTSGDELVRPLRDRGAEVVILTGLAAKDRRGACLRAGAAAVLDKALPFAQLVGALRAVAAGDPVMRPAERDELLQAADDAEAGARRRGGRFAALTARERAVLLRLTEGRSARDIAELDDVKVSTVRSHIQSILSKLGVSSQQAAIALALREGFTA